jgi:hypothetical protein
MIVTEKDIEETQKLLLDIKTLRDTMPGLRMQMIFDGNRDAVKLCDNLINCGIAMGKQLNRILVLEQTLLKLQEKEADDEAHRRHSDRRLCNGQCSNWKYS